MVYWLPEDPTIATVRAIANLVSSILCTKFRNGNRVCSQDDPRDCQYQGYENSLLSVFDAENHNKDLSYSIS